MKQTNNDIYKFCEKCNAFFKVKSIDNLCPVCLSPLSHTTTKPYTGKGNEQ